MADEKERDREGAPAELEKTIGAKEDRRITARRERDHSLLFGLSIFGIVGWSVVIPTLIGVALGIWIDGRWPGRFSWTLMLLFGGLICGCLNAWYWVSHVSKND
ncbi:MAG: ATPase F0F1 [Deltaproteobacteria bacterium]|nr:ATPase F0F1 [Deltaproteobacteria bacterium]